MIYDMQAFHIALAILAGFVAGALFQSRRSRGPSLMLSKYDAFGTLEKKGKINRRQSASENAASLLHDA